MGSRALDSPPCEGGAPVLAMGKYARLTPFARGQMVGLDKAGVPVPRIRKLVLKKDGKRPSERSVFGVLAKAAAEPDWDGKDSSAGGRPPALSEATKKALVDLVVEERGSYVVTAPFCQKRIPALRKVSPDTVRRALHEAGLAWLRRWVKRVVPKLVKKARVRYAKNLLKRRSFARTAYTGLCPRRAVPARRADQRQIQATRPHGVEASD